MKSFLLCSPSQVWSRPAASIWVDRTCKVVQSCEHWNSHTSSCCAQTRFVDLKWPFCLNTIHPLDQCSFWQLLQRLNWFHLLLQVNYHIRLESHYAFRFLPSTRVCLTSLFTRLIHPSIPQNETHLIKFGTLMAKFKEINQRLDPLWWRYWLTCVTRLMSLLWYCHWLNYF